jgi:hypothetical protein
VSNSAIGPLSTAVANEVIAANLEDAVFGLSVFATPPDTTAPYVRWGEKSEKPMDALGRPGVQCSIAIELASTAGTDAEVLDLYGYVKSALEDNAFGVVDFTVVQKSVWLEKTSMDPDGSTWRAVARLDAVLQAA